MSKMKTNVIFHLKQQNHFLTVLLFAGTVSSGLKLHPDGAHLIYPVGCTIVVEKVANKKQEFLTGHTNTVSCLALSKSGDFIASGQVTYMGFKVTAPLLITYKLM